MPVGCIKTLIAQQLYGLVQGYEDLNGSYQHECYTPLLIFCGRHLLSAKLRPANVDPAAGALGELQRLIAHIRGKVNGPRRHFVVTAFNAEQVH